MTCTQTLAAAQKEAFLAAHALFSDPALEPQFDRMAQSLASLQSWLEYHVTTTNFDAEVRCFFVEAVNDSIVAYSMARVGTWRPALQSLRSALENTLVFLYYKDHPVELKLWEQERHRTGFAELCAYFKGHPLLASFDHQTETGIVSLEEMYAKLSRAVHASATFMRMTAMAQSDELPSMHVPSEIELSRFVGLLTKLVEYLNLLLVGLFRDALSGTSLPLLRGAIAAAMADKRRKSVKKAFGVALH